MWHTGGPHDSALPAHARVVCAWSARSPIEVSVMPGEVVTVLEIVKSGVHVWCKVEAGSGRGLVPASMVEIVRREPPDSSATPPPPSKRSKAPSGPARGTVSLSSFSSATVSSCDSLVFSVTPPASIDSVAINFARQPPGPALPTVPLAFVSLREFDLGRELRSCPPGGVVTVPPGVHMVSGPLALDRSITLRGESSRTTAVAVGVPAGGAAGLVITGSGSLTLLRLTLGLAEGSSDGGLLLSASGASASVNLEECASVGPVWLRDGSKGCLDRCDMRVPRGSVAAIVASSTASVQASLCVIHDCVGGGVLADAGGSISLTECHLHDNRVAGAAAHGKGKLSVIRTHVNNCTAPGLMFREQSEGGAEDCDLDGNRQGGIVIESGAKPLVRRCRISGGHAGVVALQNAEGRVEDCDISSGDFAGIYIKTGAKPAFVRCMVHDGAGTGLSVHRDGQGLFEACEIVGHALAGVSVETGGKPLLRRCKVLSGKAAGIMVTEGGRITLEDSEVVDNASHCVHVSKRGAADMHRCRLSSGKFYVAEEGIAIAEACSIDGGNDFHPKATVQIS